MVGSNAAPAGQEAALRPLDCNLNLPYKNICSALLLLWQQLDFRNALHWKQDAVKSCIFWKENICSGDTWNSSLSIIISTKSIKNFLHQATRLRSKLHKSQFNPPKNWLGSTISYLLSVFAIIHVLIAWNLYCKLYCSVSGLSKDTSQWSRNNNYRPLRIGLDKQF